MDHDHSHHMQHNHPQVVDNVTSTSTTGMPMDHHNHHDHSMHMDSSNETGNVVNHALHHMMEMAVSNQKLFSSHGSHDFSF